MKHIPNFFTLLNLVFGCLAIVFILQVGIQVIADTRGTELIYIPEKIWIASLFIGLAAVVDFMDGFIARLFKASSELGKQLDSLADVVSFGVAPGLILYQFLRLAVAQEPDGMDSSFIWLLPAFLLPAAAAWRLARFNLDKNQGFSFKGLPVPATGLVVASLPLIYWNMNEPWVQQLLLNKWFLYAIIILLSGLMVSTLPLLALKFRNFGFKNNLPKYIIILMAIISIVIFRWMAAPVIVLSYVLISLLFKKQTA